MASTIGVVSSIRSTGEADEPLDELQQVLVIGELDVGLLQETVPLHEDRVGPVDQHVAHLGVVHDLLDRTEAVDLVHQLLDHQVLVPPGEVHLRPA